MKCLLVSLVLFFSVSTLIAQNFLSDDTIKFLYKQADMIFTAIVKYENIKANTVGEEYKLVDFDITEIQKGRDYSRLIVQIPDSDTVTYKQGKEYLVFAKFDRKSNRYYILFSEHVCKSCTNYTIRKVYNIIDKTPFATIKKPREKTPWNERGCGCY